MNNKTKNIPPICRWCHVKMKKGMALENGLTGSPDFEGDQNGVTVSPDPLKVKLVPCWKCPKCGHSITVTKLEILLQPYKLTV